MIDTPGIAFAPEASIDQEQTREDVLVEAVREFARLVGVENIRIGAHDVPFAAFEGVPATVLHFEGDDYSRAHSWLSGDRKINGVSFSMHSIDLPDAQPEMEDEAVDTDA